MPIKTKYLKAYNVRISGEGPTLKLAEDKLHYNISVFRKFAAEQKRRQKLAKDKNDILNSLLEGVGDGL